MGTFPTGNSAAFCFCQLTDVFIYAVYSGLFHPKDYCIVENVEGSKSGGRGRGVFKLHMLVFIVCKLTFCLLSTQQLYIAVNQFRPCQSVASISCLLVKATVG